MSAFLYRLADMRWSVASLLAGAMFWELGARIVDVSVFPTLSAVMVRMVELLGEPETISNLVTSLGNLGIGFAIALVLGLAVGIAMGVSETFDMAFDIYVKAMLTAPGLVFAPIFFSVLGLSRWTIIGVIVLYATFIIMLNTSAAIKEAPANLIEMGEAFCASRWFIVRKVIVPAAVPLIMAGVRLGAGRAVKGMINGEMFIAVVGLGGAVMAAGRNLDLATVLAIMTLIILIAFAVLGIVEWADRRLTPWVVSNVRE